MSKVLRLIYDLSLVFVLAIIIVPLALAKVLIRLWGWFELKALYGGDIEAQDKDHWRGR